MTKFEYLVRFMALLLFIGQGRTIVKRRIFFKKNYPNVGIFEKWGQT